MTHGPPPGEATDATTVHRVDPGYNGNPMSWKDHLGPIATTIIGGILIATFIIMIGGVNRRIDALGAGLQRTNERIDTLGAEIRTEIRHAHERIDALGAEIRTEIRRANGRIERTNERIDRTNERIDRVLEILQAPAGADAR